MSAQGRIIICGATGHTGRRTAQVLVELDERPLLAGRDAEGLKALAARLADCETAVVDLARPESIRQLLAAGDVLVSTVGPFARLGDAPIQAAIAAGAWYVDSTGEPPFVRKVFDHYGPQAQARGTGLVTAFGYEYVPGNLAAALALREAGPAAVRVDVGYFLTGAARAAAGPAARASLAATLAEPMYAWRGQIRDEPGGARMRTFTVAGRARPGLSIGASEHFALPRLYPRLAEVNVYLGWFGPATGPLHQLSRLTPVVTRLPFGKTMIERTARLAIEAGTVEPTPQSMTDTGSYFVAAAYDAAGEQLAQVALAGGHHLQLTARLLAWAALRAARGRASGRGALGPVEAFGLDQLRDGCAQAGLTLIA